MNKNGDIIRPLRWVYLRLLHWLYNRIQSWSLQRRWWHIKSEELTDSIFDEIFLAVLE